MKFAILSLAAVTGLIGCAGATIEAPVAGAEAPVANGAATLASPASEPSAEASAALEQENAALADAAAEVVVVPQGQEICYREMVSGSRILRLVCERPLSEAEAQTAVLQKEFELRDLREQELLTGLDEETSSEGGSETE